ncbi:MULTISPECIES: amidohydrolase [unclassified Mesorhizobium]|uniref:amidohydrolase n=1 Tax=unclassified Mesorhizobium TaxID=325217 RepID=UPI00112CE758|nr:MULTISPECIES: amidohydrolase [unclassified Mesorhizobium]TPJ45996.1 amidohydrolase [Mesorhizobium sp. B2-6-6]MBZ9982424.1 amidohydrolase [Mesorhizobium sp. BR-1-1-8]MCA0008485.1 amidohydrolase [Mesorhizobium sp. B264B1B]MCA0021307.1 amidohydrolase [Mesorhizobium sp. B264B1A]MCA0026318.1 amidohydrolase [Mesorhizobium sp. B263B1A]
MSNGHGIWMHVDGQAGRFIELSDRVWETPELNYQEHRSSAEHLKALNDQGFRVATGLAGMPTAIMGEAGEGGPVIAFLGEFDALPELSQEAGVAEHRRLSGNGPGHGCGHNLLGAGALLAATATKDWLAANSLPGRVRYYGCPAEEGGSGKAFMVRDGVFADVDAALSWHPFSFAGVMEPASLAYAILDFSYTGRSAHAAGSPHLGRSALDAVELMSVGVNYLREHIPSDCRVHYAYLNAGGPAPNIVQAAAIVRYMVRSPRASEVLMLVERVKRIAEGAALMSETQVESRFVCAMNSLLGNRVMEGAMAQNFEMLGPPEFDAADQAFAGQIQATLTREHIQSAYAMFRLQESDSALSDGIVGAASGGKQMLGSTDVGDVSWAVPTVQAYGATYAIGTPLHTWQVTAQGKSPHAHKGMIHVAKALAATAADLFSHPDLLASAKEEHAARLARDPAVQILPPHLAPPLDG